MTHKKEGMNVHAFRFFRHKKRLNLPLAIPEQDNPAPVRLNARHGHVFPANHKVHMDHRVIHAQFAVLSIRAFGGTL